MAEKLFHLQAPSNIAGARRIALNREAFEFYRYVLSQVDLNTADFGKLAAQLAADDPTVGQTQHQLMLGFVSRLAEQLPKLAAIGFEKGLISIPMACAMERALQDLPAIPEYAVITDIQRILVNKLTPRINDQHLPSPRALGRLIRKALEEYREIGTPKPTKPELWISAAPKDGMWYITAEVNQLDAERINEQLNQTAKTNHYTKAEAFVDLLTGETKATNITIYGIGTFQPNAQLTINELTHTGDLHYQDNAQNMQIRYRNVLDIAQLQRIEYVPTPDQKATTEQRDGHCRYPGCMVPAQRCDIDHVINHAAGGWTTLGNLQCLCRHHHNMKTDRRIRAEITPDGAVTWYDTNPDIGKEHQHLGTTQPEGPLAGLVGRTDSNTRHSGKTSKDDDTRPPTRHGKGRFGSTFDQHNANIHKKRNEHRYPPEPYPDPPF
ncbi:MAG: HNH endonuclease [Corynebacterium sp.]|nr:HNH endonuclease [Corynebacterium sp.]